VGERRLWYVALTVGGDRQDVGMLLPALERLSRERPFLLGGRFAADRAELRYWDEAEALEDAAALALRLWGEHRLSAGLPHWSVLGLVVLERETVSRGSATVRPSLVGASPTWRPFD
jgi:hypothetical protein